MRFFTYLRDIKGELRHVNWPTKQQAVYFTIIVVIISLLTGAYLGLFDFLFTTALQEFIL